MAEAGLGFADHLWGFVDGRPVQNAWRTQAEAPTDTPLSHALAKDLKKRGFTFCGPVIFYAFLQATGLINDHLVTCPRHPVVAALGDAR